MMKEISQDYIHHFPSGGATIFVLFSAAIEMQLGMESKEMKLSRLIE